MPCFSPLVAWQTDAGAIVFAERGKIRRELTLPCGQCIGCRLERSRQWAVRCMHEAQMHDSNCFLTLTYDDEHVPAHGDLVYRHFQLFMKRLRKRVGVPVRFFMCGEYGENTNRPHFHAVLFGFRPSDLVLFKRGGSGCDIYTSKLISEIWTDGFASVGELTFESAAYVARYVCKKVVGKDADSHYWRTDPLTGECFPVTPEFGHMSLKPGIGSDWLDKFCSDVYPHDYVVINGKEAKPPRYYDKRLMTLDPDAAGFLEVGRYARSLLIADDSSYDRLRVRELVTRARLRFKSRSLE